MICVAGVIVHGDRQWTEIDSRVGALIDEYIPERDRPGFVFHATDIFHGSRYFHRDNPEWPQERRFGLLLRLAAIIKDLNLPLVAACYDKAKWAVRANEAIEEFSSDRPDLALGLMHIGAALDCLTRADSWLAKFSPDELAAVVHEEGPKAKQQIKLALRAARGRLPVPPEFADTQKRVSLPLKRIIDTIHWAEKPDARPLQLADLTAFTFCRIAKGMPTGDQPHEVVLRQLWEIIQPQMVWMFEAKQPISYLNDPEPDGGE